ncbi:hypothetical protein CRUP_010843 [Coryphaenoides rupestris]|nr:hypothetical protein CRUP_010843 [Coryphaenoides rupestris]
MANSDKVLQYETFISDVLRRDLQEDSSKVFVAVGYGFFVEMSHSEALRFIEKKTKQLNAFTELLTKDSAKIKANIHMVLEGLRELQGLADFPEDHQKNVL